MPSAINELHPIAGNPTTASVRANFLTAKNEITALQSIADTAAKVETVDWVPPTASAQIVAGQIIVRPGRSAPQVTPGVFLGMPASSGIVPASSTHYRRIWPPGREEYERWVPQTGANVVIPGEIVVKAGYYPDPGDQYATPIPRGAWIGMPGDASNTPRYESLIGSVPMIISVTNPSITPSPSPTPPHPGQIAVAQPRAASGPYARYDGGVWVGLGDEWVPSGAQGSSPTPPRFARIWPGNVTAVEGLVQGPWYSFAGGLGNGEIRFTSASGTGVINQMFVGAPLAAASPTPGPTRLLWVADNTVIGLRTQIGSSFFPDQATPSTNITTYGNENMMSGSRCLYNKIINIGTANEMGFPSSFYLHDLPADQRGSRSWSDCVVIGANNELKYSTPYEKVILMGSRNKFGRLHNTDVPEPIKDSVIIGWDNDFATGATGGYSDLLGIGAQLDKQGVTQLSESIAIGNRAKFYPGGIHLGNDNHTTISYGPGTGTAFTNRSDARLKDNIINADIERCLADIKRLPVKRFSYKPFVRSTRDRTVTGFVAAEFARVFPKSIVRDRYQRGNHVIEDCLSTDTSQLVPTLVAAVQALSAQVEALRAR